MYVSFWKIFQKENYSCKTQRRIKNPARHLQQSFFAKMVAKLFLHFTITLGAGLPPVCTSTSMQIGFRSCNCGSGSEKYRWHILVRGRLAVILNSEMTVIFNPGYGQAKNQFQQIWSNYTWLEQKFKTDQFSYKKEAIKVNIF